MRFHLPNPPHPHTPWFFHWLLNFHFTSLAISFHLPYYYNNTDIMMLASSCTFLKSELQCSTKNVFAFSLCWGVWFWVPSRELCEALRDLPAKSLSLSQVQEHSWQLKPTQNLAPINKTIVAHWLQVYSMRQAIYITKPILLSRQQKYCWMGTARVRCNGNGGGGKLVVKTSIHCRWEAGCGRPKFKYLVINNFIANGC
jgi:hypothetical protein